jgi:peptidoglycan hydrolase-like protein with peptidoglycan-binding domain
MKRPGFIILAIAVILPLAFLGCKGKVESETETDLTEATAPSVIEEVQVTEPAQTVATEMIPPTSAPETIAKPVAPAAPKADRNRDIQKALKNAGFYAGAIDGKVGPKTKEAVREFQKAKGLKVDGRVGPKTWAELEKYLVQQ